MDNHKENRNGIGDAVEKVGVVYKMKGDQYLEEEDEEEEETDMITALRNARASY
jgi:hypothetical protein